MNFQPKVNTEEHFNIRYRQVHEVSKLYGYECYYFRATDTREDDIFKEIEARTFDDLNKHVFFYTKDNDTFYNGSESFGGFGYLPSYSDIKYIAKKWFDDVLFEPIEGDLIYDVNEKTMFEITKVDENLSEYNGDKIQDRVFNHKLFLKLYNADFNDDISGVTELSDVDLIALNEELTGLLDTEDVVTISPENPFGELKQ